jgi:hypothetical protein
MDRISGDAGGDPEPRHARWERSLACSTCPHGGRLQLSTLAPAVSSDHSPQATPPRSGARREPPRCVAIPALRGRKQEARSRGRTAAPQRRSAGRWSGEDAGLRRFVRRHRGPRYRVVSRPRLRWRVGSRLDPPRYAMAIQIETPTAHVAAVERRRRAHARVLCRQHAAPLFAMASMILNDADTATEIVADTLAAACHPVHSRPAGAGTRLELARSVYWRCIGLIAATERFPHSTTATESRPFGPGDQQCCSPQPCGIVGQPSRGGGIDALRRPRPPAGRHHPTDSGSPGRPMHSGGDPVRHFRIPAA